MTRHTWAVAGITGAAVVAATVTAWLLYSVVTAVLDIAQTVAALVHTFDGAVAL